MPAGCRPRTVTLAPFGLSTFARLMTVTISSEASGWPSRPVGDARLELQVLKLRAREVADQLRVRAFAQNQDVQRVA